MMSREQVCRLVMEKGKGRHRVAPNLYLQVDGERASWLLRYHMNGMNRAMGLGNFEDVDLNKARRDAAKYRLMVKGGVDPIEARREAAKAARDEMIRSGSV